MQHLNASFLLASAIFSFLTFSPLTAPADDWPNRRGSNQDGISSETQWSHQWPEGSPTRLWKANVGTGFSSVVIANQLAYTLGNSNGLETVYCLDANNGNVRWKYSYSEPINPKMYEGGPNSTPTVHGNIVFVASRTAQIFALNAATGSLVWSNNITEYVGAKNGQWGLAASPVYFKERLYLNYGSAMVALNAATGKPLWKSAQEDKGEYSFSTPVLSSTTGSESPTLLAHMHKALYALNPDTGSVLWRHEFGRGYETHCSDPVILPEGVFISSGDDGGELIRYDQTSGTRVWKNKNLGTFTGTAIARNGYLYGVDSGSYKKGQQELRCIDVKTGEIKWSLPGFSQDGWIAAGDRLIVLTEKGELVIARLQPDKGEVVARAQIMGGKCWPQPTLANGKLYCRNAKGEVFCFIL